MNNCGSYRIDVQNDLVRAAWLNAYEIQQYWIKLSKWRQLYVSSAFFPLSGWTSYIKISRSLEIGDYIDRMDLIFDRHLRNAAADVSVKCQSDWKSLNPNLAASRFHEISRKDGLTEDVCQISERYDHYNIQSRGFETSRDLAISRPSV